MYQNLTRNLRIGGEIALDKIVDRCYIMNMKYDNVTKRNRNSELVNYRKNHPELSLQEIGEVFNISKQRVSILLLKYGGNYDTKSNNL